ncbi:MAG: aldehyde dehydrogenase family protein [Trueperaceae bacterium]|nr:aldehyde dehydrogenase family protein [Trueperaceae bacterium]
MSVQTILGTMDEGTVLEPPTAARGWLEHHKQHFGGFVGGSWRKHKDAPNADVLNPATGEVLASVKVVGGKEVEAALKAARKAQPAWEERARASSLRTWAQKVRSEQGTLAQLETLASGRPIRQAKHHDLPPLVRWLEHHAERSIALPDSFSGYAARGVVALIVDHTAPLRFALRALAPALAAGCTVVLVASVGAPLALFRLADLARDAGIPEGVLNVLVGDADAKTALAAADIDVLAYAGTPDVATSLYRQSAERDVARLVVLNDPSVAVVFEDADLDAAVGAVVDALRSNAPAGVRVLVQESVERTFHRRLRDHLQTLETGDPLAYRSDLGPLPDEAYLEGLEPLLAGAADLGAISEPIGTPRVDRPAFVAPTLLPDVAPALPVAQSPLPGPLLLTQTFRTPSEAVALVNQNRFASSVTVWSETQGVALAVADGLEPPSIFINSTVQTDPAAPHSVARDSGFGTLGGDDGLALFLRLPPLDSAPTYDDVASADAPRPADIGPAVKAAVKAAAWSQTPVGHRARLLLSCADALAQQAETLTGALMEATDQKRKEAEAEVVTALELAYAYATMPNTGRLEPVPWPGLVTSAPVPYGVLGIVCPDAPALLGLVGLLVPALLGGNRVVVVPPTRFTGLDEVVKTMTALLPPGVVNVVRGDAKTLARHGNVAALWCFGGGGARAELARAAADRLVPLWSPDQPHGCFGVSLARRYDTLRHATRRKTVWTSYGL